MSIRMAEQYQLAANEARQRAEKATKGKTAEAWIAIADEWVRLAEASDKAERRG